MEKGQIKSLSLTKTKIAETEGEHTITFVASSSNEDRDFERLEIGTFRLPLKGGGEIRVADLPQGGADNVDIPLLTDHDLWSVDKVIGSVRRASYINGELVFEAGISSIPRAQELFKLVEEGHLDNAFSIQYRDYRINPETQVQTDGEIIEVSLVTRGANPDARVLATKSMKGLNVETEKSTPEIVEEKDEQLVAEAEAAAEAEAPKEAEEKPAEIEETPAEAEEAKPEVSEDQEVTTNEKEMKMDKEVAKSLVKEASQAATSATFGSNDYLKSKAAMADFAKTIASNRGNKVAIKSAWEANLKAKGLAGTFTLPTELESIFFHAWNDVEADVFSTFRRSNMRAGTAIAFYGAQDEDIRAKGHKKGETKADQTLTAIQRDLKGKIAYKKLGIDLIDLLEDTSGELLRFRTEELTDRLRTEVYTAIVLGDGRSSGTPDYRLFDGSRGLYSIVGDLNGSTVANSYASLVATKVANVQTDTIYDKIVKALGAVEDRGTTRGSNRRKVVVISSADKTNLLLTKNENGGYLFPVGSDLNALFDARIITLDGIANSGYDVIAYADQGYTLLGTDDMVRTDFDISTNTDYMLVERLVSGSLEGHKVAAGYVSANASA